LRQPVSDLTAIVTVTDDGGSSGRLRRENASFARDIRNCMVALSQDKALLGHLFHIALTPATASSAKFRGEDGPSCRRHR